MFLNKEIKLNFKNAKLKAFLKFIKKYKHYVIALICVLILTLVLFLTVVYPNYCQNVKLRFLDKNKLASHISFDVHFFFISSS